MPYERPQNSVEIAIFRVAKEGPLKISRSSGNDAELLFLCSFNSVSEFFLSTRKDRLSKSNRPTLVFSFFLFEKFIVETAGAFFGSTGFVVYRFFFPVFIRTCSTLHLDLVRMPSAGSLEVLRECHLTSVPWSEGWDWCSFRMGSTKISWSCAGNKLRSFQKSMSRTGWFLFQIGERWTHFDYSSSHNGSGKWVYLQILLSFHLVGNFPLFTIIFREKE